MGGRHRHMRKIALYGLFNPAVVKAFKSAFKDEFKVVEVAEEGDYTELRDAEYIVNRVFYMRQDIFEQAVCLKMVQKWGAGYDKVDVEAAAKFGIPVVNCIGINAAPVAELTVLLMLSVLRKLIPQVEALKEGLWVRDEYAKTTRMLRGKQVGVIGFGRIGQEVSQIVSNGFGATVVYYDAYRQPEEKEMALGVKYVSLNTLLSTSDVISIHIPLSENTEKFINAEKLAKMKKSAILVNTARGKIVDEQALIDALQHKVIAGAGLDTYESEPLGKDSPLLQMENVVATPHCGGNTADNDEKMVKCCVDSIRSFDGGRWPTAPQLVNQKQLNQYRKDIRL